MTEPVDAAADPSRVEGLLRNLKALSMTPDAGTIAGSPAEYGLGEEAVTVRVFGTDRQKPLAALRAGGTVGDLRYIQPVGESGIEVVDARLLARSTAPASEWRDRALFRLPTFQIASLAVTGPGRDLKATRDREEGRWRLIRPFRTPADEAKMEGVLADLGAIVVADGADGFVANDVRDFAPYGLDSPAMTHRAGPSARLRGAADALVGQGGAGPGRPALCTSGRSGRRGQIDAKSLLAHRDLARRLAQSEGRRHPAGRRSIPSGIEALGRVFELVRTPSGWDLIRPSRGKADPEAVQALILGLASCRRACSSTRRRWRVPRSSPRP